MNINLEYRKGILFIRLNGALTRRNINTFEEEVIPVILKNGIRFIVINMDELENIDNNGVDAVIELYSLVKRNKGKLSFCNIKNEEINKKIKDSVIPDVCYETKSELSALELFNV